MDDPVALPKSLDELFREYAWDYFALHADHRLRAFHFYILLSTYWSPGVPRAVVERAIEGSLAPFAPPLMSNVRRR